MQATNCLLEHHCTKATSEPQRILSATIAFVQSNTFRLMDKPHNDALRYWVLANDNRTE